MLIDFLLNDNYQLIFNATYKHANTQDDLDYFNSTCTIKSVLCYGGGQINNNAIRIMACARCYQVLTPTIRNIPAYYGLAWWYLTVGYSMGFSPDSNINQNHADVVDVPSEFRLSWEVGNNISGYRAGSLNAWYNDVNQLIKYVFVKHRKLICSLF